MGEALSARLPRTLRRVFYERDEGTIARMSFLNAPTAHGGVGAFEKARACTDMEMYLSVFAFLNIYTYSKLDRFDRVGMLDEK